jgi:all-trans-retinol 13,14-reductase
MRTTGRPYKKHQGIQGSYDVIVVGSGMGGMTAAVMLAKQNYKVLLLEQNSVVGGLTQSYSRGGYRWNTGLHYIGDVAHEKTLTAKLFSYVTNHKVKWAPLPEIYNQMVIADRTYDVPAGKESYANALKSWFPDEAAAIDQYINLLFTAAKSSQPYFMQKAFPEAFAAEQMTEACAPFHEFSRQRTIDVLQQLTNNQELIAVICANWGDYSSPPHRSSFAMHCMLAKHYMNGGSYPHGGAGVLADLMMPIVEQAGGEVLHGAEVSEVIIEANKAVGVKLTSGEDVRASIIVSNAGVQNTYGRLLPKGHEMTTRLQSRLDDVSDTYALVGINLGLNVDAEALNLKSANIWAHPSADFEQNLADHETDFSAPFPWLFITFPSVKDPAWEGEYAGKSTIEMYAYTHYKHFAEWAGSRWMKRGASYEARKLEIKERLLTDLERFVAGVRKHIDVCEVSTPLTYETFVKRERGGFMGIESTPDRFRQSWLRASTPIEGLYLAGQDVTTDGVIGALMGGLISATAVTGKDLLTEVATSRPD